MQKAPSGAPVFAIPRWKWHNRNPWNSKQLVAQQIFSQMDTQACIIFLDSTLQKEVVKKRIHWPLGQKFTIMHSQQSPSHQSPSLPRSCKHIHSPLVLFPLQKATISVQTFWINVPHLMLRLLIKHIPVFESFSMWSDADYPGWNLESKKLVQKGSNGGYFSLQKTLLGGSFSFPKK